LKRSPGTASSRRPKRPKDIVDKINADVNEALRQPEVQDQLKKLSAGFSAARSTRRQIHA
jgi:tripartite-type tricarboxylate transporter receptor subunit TctC